MLRGGGRGVSAVGPVQDPYHSLPVPEGAGKRAGEGLLTRARRDRTRGNGFKLKEGRFRTRYEEEILYYEGGEALEQVAQ